LVEGAEEETEVEEGEEGGFAAWSWLSSHAGCLLLLLLLLLVFAACCCCRCCPLLPLLLPLLVLVLPADGVA
jgi:hypothetical protein